MRAMGSHIRVPWHERSRATSVNIARGARFACTAAPFEVTP
jgi:hypothetical protein